MSGECRACRFFDPHAAPDATRAHLGQCLRLSGPTVAFRAQDAGGEAAAVFVAPSFSCGLWCPADDLIPGYDK